MFFATKTALWQLLRALRHETMVGGALLRASVVSVDLGVSGATIVSGSCVRPSYSWVSRLSTSSLSLGISSLFYTALSFDGHSNSDYKNCLQVVYPSEVSHEYDSFINAMVGDQDNGVWTTDIVQCLHQGILPSMRPPLPVDIILEQKSSFFDCLGR